MNLLTGKGSGGSAEGDTYRLVEDVSGSNRGDLLIGNGAYNVLEGRDGDDRIEGRSGGDYLDGGDGVDTLEYFDSVAGVQIDLAAGTAAGGSAQDDQIFNFENVWGSAFADSLTGDDGANALNGFAGGDLLNGLGGDDILKGGLGKDTLDGGAGVDTADYSDKTAAVVVNLNGDTNAAVRVGGVAEDVIRNIENVTGGAGADTLWGDNLANALFGGGGDDVLRGAGGADVLDGGAGIDTADYSYLESFPVRVVLNGASDATVTVRGVTEDTLRNIENVTGGGGGDMLIGDGLANVLLGGGGYDFTEWRRRRRSHGRRRGRRHRGLWLHERPCRRHLERGEDLCRDGRRRGGGQNPQHRECDRRLGRRHAARRRPRQCALGRLR
ncbi:calcium-binding protein [Methylosinus sp. Sm6]|uniref:calcium-binding protein n=1 Tax=Methylosinus sp. Sm6 TaxID=2866948 RepID=UPI00351D0588